MLLLTDQCIINPHYKLLNCDADINLSNYLIVIKDVYIKHTSNISMLHQLGINCCNHTLLLYDIYIKNIHTKSLLFHVFSIHCNYTYFIYIYIYYLLIILNIHR